MVLVLQVVHHSQLCFAVVHAEHPANLRKRIVHAKTLSTKMCLVNLHDVRELQVGLNKLGHIMTASFPEKCEVRLYSVLAQSFNYTELGAVNEKHQTKMEGL